MFWFSSVRRPLRYGRVGRGVLGGAITTAEVVMLWGEEMCGPIVWWVKWLVAKRAYWVNQLRLRPVASRTFDLLLARLHHVHRQKKALNNTRAEKLTMEMEVVRVLVD